MLERSGELAALGAAARAAARGTGSIALVFGEAGIGKSTVVRALRTAFPAEARLLVGYCDALSTPRTLGPFKDTAHALGGDVLDAVSAGQRDAVMTALHGALASGAPTVLVVEDVHWADEATLDTLRFLARRIDTLPVLLVLTYRDELDRDHPLTAMLGDLGHRSDVVRLPLRRLSPAAVAELVAGQQLDARSVFDLSDGNPYLVTELIASTTDTGTTPATVVDGVLGRLRLLPAPVQDVVEQLAVLPGAADRTLTDALVPDAWQQLDQAEARGLLTTTGGTVTFRHELTRRAVVDSLSGSRRVELNRVALRVLEGQSWADVSQLVHHAVEAGDDDAVVRHGPGAAREAAASGAHREAASHYGTVLEHEGRFALLQQARLWEAYAVELYTIGDDTAGVPAGERAVSLWRGLHDASALARSLRWLSRFCWTGGFPDAARDAAAEATVVARSGDDDGVLALALSNEAQLAMLGDDAARSLPLARQAIEIARRIGDDAVLSHALTNLGSALFNLHGDNPAAREALQEAIDVALAIDDHEDACRGYVNLSSSLIDFGRLDDAEPFALAGVEHAEKAEFVVFHQYLLALRSRIALARGRWDEVTTLLERVTPQVLPAWCISLTMRAAMAVRRGDPEATQLIRDGWELAVRLDEMQRTAQLACLALEAATLTGTDPVVDAAALLPAARAADNGKYADELTYRLAAHGANPPPLESAAHLPYASMLQGRWQDAAAQWAGLGWPYQQAEALACSTDIDDLLTALDIADRLGATPLTQRVRRRLRDLGEVRVPRGPSRDSRSDPAGLTGRQQTVLALLADGLTNGEIAERLVLSVRTVDSHVAAIFVKLGVSTRREAAAVQHDRVSTPDLGNQPNRSR
ncbi:AAA family ATPase [uncultured Jatrophihabitans sp.]|uniref:ATP-binding protein n=1 Tax=uncultured Jatrophihabitans sp. TaxID=1610747 RepID=UPI0035CB19C5